MHAHISTPLPSLHLLPWGLSEEHVSKHANLNEFESNFKQSLIDSPTLALCGAWGGPRTFVRSYNNNQKQQPADNTKNLSICSETHLKFSEDESDSILTWRYPVLEGAENVVPTDSHFVQDAKHGVEVVVLDNV